VGEIDRLLHDDPRPLEEPEKKAQLTSAVGALNKQIEKLYQSNWSVPAAIGKIRESIPNINRLMNSRYFS